MHTSADYLNTGHGEGDIGTEFSQGMQKGNSKIITKLESILNQFSQQHLT